MPASTTTIQSVVKYARTFPDLYPILNVSGSAAEPALTIANDTMMHFLDLDFDWKFNRSQIVPFITVALQQDYIGVQPQISTGNTGIQDFGWLERGNRIDINNSAVPKPNFPMETVRDLPKTSWQANPFNISAVPVRLAFMGTWTANYLYQNGIGMPFAPNNPIQQFIDANGNFLYLSTYGMSGTVQPILPANSAAGTTVTDNQVVWTVADPYAYCIRISPIPPTSGLVWQIWCEYQMRAPLLTSLSQTIAPIPDDMADMFRAGFVAHCREHASPGSKGAQTAMLEWIEALQRKLRAEDRQQEDNVFYPSCGLTGGGAIWPTNAANPYGWGSYGY